MKLIKYTIGVLIAIFALIAVVFAATDNGIWHEAKDIKPGIFGDDESDSLTSYIFNNKVEFNDEIEITTIKSNDDNGNVIIQLG